MFGHSRSAQPTPSQRMMALGLRLPPVAAPLASYVPSVFVDGLIYTSGNLPTIDGKLVAAGKVGAEVTPDEAYRAARVAALNALAAAAAQTSGGIDSFNGIVKLTVFVASAPGFTGQAQVANGASDLIEEIFGAKGRHARSAVGVAVLPVDAPVEVEMIVNFSRN